MFLVQEAGTELAGLGSIVNHGSSFALESLQRKTPAVVLTSDRSLGLPQLKSSSGYGNVDRERCVPT